MIRRSVTESRLLENSIATTIVTVCPLNMTTSLLFSVCSVDVFFKDPLFWAVPLDAFSSVLPLNIHQYIKTAL